MKLEIVVNVFLHPCSDSEKLEQILQRLITIEEKENQIMATLDDVLADVTAEPTQIAGLKTLILGLAQQLADALAGVNLPPAVQAKVDAIFAGAEANKAAIADALNAGTPAAPTT